jgi:hypothetical protein
MKLRLAAALLLTAGGIVLWLTMKRGSQPVPQSPLDAAVPGTQPGRVNARPSTVAPEGNPEVPEEIAAADTNAPLPGPVAPKPKPVSLAALEEPPVAPEETSEGAASSLPPATALENMRSVFRHYNQRFGGNPVGSNREITATLGGQNPQQANFINPDDGARVNSQGEIVDHWDNPYFFHQLSRTEMEIRSAGPDRRMWTSDDLVLK